MKSFSILVFPDLHLPFHHRRAFAAALRLAHDTRPAIVGQIGDFADFHAVSRHPKTHGVARDFAAELAGARAAGKELWDATRSAKRRFVTFGNHDTNLERTIAQQAPELECVVPTVAEILRFPADVETCHFHEHIMVENILFTHVVTPRKTRGQHVVAGHTHTPGIWYTGDPSGSRHFYMNVGYLADWSELRRVYARSVESSDWTLALGWIDVDSRGGATATVIPYVNDAFCFRGNSYRAR